MRTPRLASKPLAVGPGNQNAEDERSVILLPWLINNEIAALHIWVPPHGFMTGIVARWSLDPADALWKSGLIHRGAKALAHSASRSNRFTYDPQDNSFVLPTTRLPHGRISLGSLTGALAIDLPDTHYVFKVFEEKSPFIPTHGICFMNEATADYYRNVTRNLIEHMNRVDFFSMQVIAKLPDPHKKPEPA